MAGFVVLSTGGRFGLRIGVADAEALVTEALASEETRAQPIELPGVPGKVWPLHVAQIGEEG